MSQERIKELKRLLTEAAYSYYNDSDSIITDEKFDELRDELISFSPNDPFLKTIGAPVPKNSKWPKANHKIAMNSLDKVKTLDEFKKWTNKHSDQRYVVSEKLDGISINLEYENGKLVKAITRNDGIQGQVITPNVVVMQGVKENIDNFTGSIRGEIILEQTAFEEINEILDTLNEPRYKTLRNAASGIATGYENKFCHYLKVIFYDCTEEFDTVEQRFDFIESLGLNHCFVDAPLDIYEVYKEWNHYENGYRASLNYEIDGLVVEVYDSKIKSSLGLNSQGRPLGSIAWKFNPIKAKSIVKEVKWQLGNTGQITPVIIIEPVKIVGVTVTRITLHNIDAFLKAELSEGDEILLKRSNDVIPYFEGKIKDNGGKRFEYPKEYDGYNTYIEGAYLRVDSAYPGLKLGDLKKWIQKTGISSKGVGDKFIEKVYELGLVEIPSDLYDLLESEIEDIEGYGKKSAKKIVNIFNECMEMSLSQFIGGLNIRNFSSDKAEKLIEVGYDTLDKIRKLTFQEINAVDGLGEISSRSLVEGLQKKKDIIDNLLFVGVRIIKKDTSKLNIQAKDGFLKGQSFCFTGEVKTTDSNGQRYTREKMQQMVAENGGICYSSVKKDLKYLVDSNEGTQTGKVKKAIKYGTTIFTEDQFFDIMKKGNL